MTVRDLHRLVTGILAAGGLGLVAIAVSAARQGVWSAAGFIGACAAVLLGAVAWDVFHQRRATGLPR